MEITKTHFCEYNYSSHLYGYEPLNGISSLIFCGYSVYFIFHNQNINNKQYVLSGLLFICGTGSMMFHLTLYDYWRIIDEVPMLWMVSISNMQIIQTNITNKILKFAFFTLNTLLILLITIENIVSENIYLFRSYFITSLIILSILIRNKINKNTYIIALIGGSCWIIDNVYCNDLTSVMHLHVLWHVCIGYFSYKTLYIFNNKELPY